MELEVELEAPTLSGGGPGGGPGSGPLCEPAIPWSPTVVPFAMLAASVEDVVLASVLPVAFSDDALVALPLPDRSCSSKLTRSEANAFAVLPVTVVVPCPVPDVASVEAKDVAAVLDDPVLAAAVEDDVALAAVLDCEALWLESHCNSASRDDVAELTCIGTTFESEADWTVAKATSCGTDSPPMAEPGVRHAPDMS